MTIGRSGLFHLHSVNAGMCFTIPIVNTVGIQYMGFKKGQSGNPLGRPRGSVNEVTRLSQILLQRDTELIIDTVIKRAIGGDMVAAKLVLDRLIPPAKERPIQIELPEMQSLGGVSQAQEAILRAAATGDLLPGEANSLSAIVEVRRRALETEILEQRVVALENARKD
jgi:hypothetical protein